MKKSGLMVLILVPLFFLNCNPGSGTSPGWNQGKIIDHSAALLLFQGNLAIQDIQNAKEKLHIAYGHTSHGSQLTTGMSGLVGFANSGALDSSSNSYSSVPDLFQFDNRFETSQTNGSLYLREDMDRDVGYYPNWVNETNSMLEANPEINVIIWSWCGQASSYTPEVLQSNYLSPMEQLQRDYPNVIFVYMTGHLDGTGVEGQLNQNNEAIRAHCIENNYWLYDFAHIESFDPDGNAYLALDGRDTCGYDGGNWAQEWQNTHTEGEDWYSCSSAHSEALNANFKAYAAWVLWAELAKAMN